MTVRFTCTSLKGTSLKGILPPDENGYRLMPIGGLNILNSAGQYYTAEGAKELFLTSSAFQRRVRSGKLRSELGHPVQQPGQSNDSYLQRVMTIYEPNVCAHIASVELDFDNFRGPEGPIVAIMGRVIPSGPHAAALERSFNNPEENVCFSIRAFTKDYQSNRMTHRILKNIITFDYVNEPGIRIAEKYQSPALESLVEPVVVPSQLERVFTTPTGQMSMESGVMNAAELFISLGWSMPFRTIPAYRKW